MRMLLDPASIDDYCKFIAIKSLPRFRFIGESAEIPDEYAGRIGAIAPAVKAAGYTPHPSLFDYQRDIAALAIRRRKFAVFADCGLGKTLIAFEFIRAAESSICKNRKTLIVSPLMVIPQTIAEAERFYDGRLRVEQVYAAELNEWLHGDGGGVGITNYEALTDSVSAGNLGCLVLDESSMLKSHYGRWGARAIRLGRGLNWKLCLTGTPAPNDRIEYANHAVFLDAFPTVNSFLARFFVNRGQTCERWELKPHALRPFYNALSHWCVFLTNPATYGWRDNSAPLPPINVQIHDVKMTQEQTDIVHERGDLFAARAGGIGSRSQLSQIGKGWYKGRRVATNKTTFIRDLIHSWPDESTIVWCLYNEEQRDVAAAIDGCESISGDTPNDRRQEIIAAFKAGRLKTIVTKSKILGFGLNLQICTRQVFSGLQDSYESYYQAVKRSNRYGSTRPLNVHIPVTDLERPMIETVLLKSDRVHADTIEQEQIFKESSDGCRIAI